jgi:hypothetical protein
MVNVESEARVAFDRSLNSQLSTLNSAGLPPAAPQFAALSRAMRVGIIT